MSLKDYDRCLRDHYPRPGERLKQYIVDGSREDAWIEETCPVFNVDPHEDNTGCECRNAGETNFVELQHDCCSTCDGLRALAEQSPRVQEWLAEKAKRPPICQDRDQLSDEIAEDPRLAPHPFLAMLPKIT